MDFLSALDKEIAQVQEKMAELQSRHDTLVELRKKYVSSPGDTKPPKFPKRVSTNLDGFAKSFWRRVLRDDPSRDYSPNERPRCPDPAQLFIRSASNSSSED